MTLERESNIRKMIGHEEKVSSSVDRIGLD